ncbi:MULTISPECIES: tripartite tricarboxylate transporter permease [Variovorax]|jgi:putative tricarboxylic transport membrane protein|uniref:tripartite tricarboxylate transporter permease n=1 Tax=Variovorax TaxID=34072 RepID=UPI000896A08C|nr:MULTISPECIES: tripartite tricarboxylate transporter permease [Variovorax]MDQ0082417.1 putative tricarboxylic transport membrane protein [Variovorax boronicumulans]SDY08956.1 putative tricarboxylic transport membrane protein [Variovorax sp. YR634]SDZ34353.1 putative tricarboxylic transport membrane protein [Variovorax sp. YR266]SES80076.1 putative tricarboxylic transport membrane protein [Variovorax sp. OV084]SOD27596.1 putative tricarboxylic transport membrane protein [Variovorax sp. YR752]
MEIFNALMAGFATAITPINLLWCLVGCALGTAVGVLPGIGPAVAVAMLLPITGKVDITASMIFFSGIYYGAMYGGSTTSILLNTPGETASMVTAMEGNKMAKSGRAGAALATAAIGSFVAGTIATVIVTLFAPFVAEFAVKLGPPEYFLLMLLAFTTVSAVLGKSTLRGMTALFVGLAAGCVGLDQISGQGRYTGGVPELLDGIEIVLVAVGLFAVAEVLYAVLYEGKVVEGQNKLSRVHMTKRDWRRSIPAWLRGTAIGTPFGCIPAGGTEIPTFLSYAMEKKLAKDKDAKAEFGTTGAIEGVAGPEAANNATVTAALIPLLTLGIPTSNTTAILLGAFQNYGIQPGPQLFTTSAALVWALIASLYIGNVMLLVLNLPMVGLWVKLLKIPKPQLYAGILIFATVGAYGMRQSGFDLFLLYAIGLLGVVMRRFDFPTAPVVVGMILGPLAEAQLRNAMSIGEGSAVVFFQRPMSIALVVIVVAVLVLPRLAKRMSERKLKRLAQLDA